MSMEMEGQAVKDGRSPGNGAMPASQRPCTIPIAENSGNQRNRGCPPPLVLALGDAILQGRGQSHHTVLRTWTHEQR